MRHLTHRFVAAAISLTLVLAACSTAQSPGSSAAATGCDTPRAGGSLVYARRAETQVLDPINIVNGNGDIFADELIFQALVRPDPKGSFDLVPGVADKWTVSSDGMTYEFHIRDGLKFSNGDPVTADDVKFSLDRFGDPKINTVMGAVAVGYKDTEVVDASTVRVHLSQPIAAFLYNISIFPAFIVPKALVQAQGAKFWEAPVGTGPFMAKEFVLGSHITFERNPNYWEAGKPYLDEVRFDFATDDNTRVLALSSGQAQMIDGVPFAKIKSLSETAGINVQTTNVPLFLGLWFNHNRPQLADQKVRQAMQYAIDRKAINTSVFNGVGTIPNSVLPPFKFDASASDLAPYALDLDKARGLMAASAYPDGFPITLQYPAGFAYYKQLALLLQNMWDAIGIKVTLIEQDQGTETDRFYQLDYDLTFPYAEFTSDVVVPDEYAYFVADPNNGLDGFFSHWHNDAIWQMIQTFGTATSETDRAAQWPKIQQALLEETPWINVIDLPFVNAFSTNVCNPLINALGANRLEDTWLKE